MSLVSVSTETENYRGFGRRLQGGILQLQTLRASVLESRYTARVRFRLAIRHLKLGGSLIFYGRLLTKTNHFDLASGGRLQNVRSNATSSAAAVHRRLCTVHIIDCTGRDTGILSQNLGADYAQRFRKL